MHDRIRHKEGYELLGEIILSDYIDRIAKRCGVHPDTVWRWCRPPECNDSPTDTGRRSPFDRFIDLMEAIFLDNPDGAAQMVDAAKARLLALQRAHGNGKFNERATVADLTDYYAKTVRELMNGELNEADIRAMRTLHRYLGRKIQEAEIALKQRKAGGRER